MSSGIETIVRSAPAKRGFGGTEGYGEICRGLLDGPDGTQIARTKVALMGWEVPMERGDQDG